MSNHAVTEQYRYEYLVGVNEDSYTCRILLETACTYGNMEEVLYQTNPIDIVLGN